MACKTLRSILARSKAGGGDGRGARQYAALAGIIHEGEGRHDALVSYAGRVWVDGRSGETFVALLQVINERQCQSPLPEDELSAIVDHFVARREPRGPAPTHASTHDSLVVCPQERPRIVITNRHLHEIGDDAWHAPRGRFLEMMKDEARRVKE